MGPKSLPLYKQALAVGPHATFEYGNGVKVFSSWVRVSLKTSSVCH